MADEESIIIEVQDNFYRDRIGLVVFIILSMVIAIVCTIGLSFYLYSQKPQPINFNVFENWRTQKSVPITEAYLAEADLLNLASQRMRKLFDFDFYHYDQQLSSYRGYFTDSGWQAYQRILDKYANAETIKTNKQFISSSPTAAPFRVNQGVLSGRYAWWIETPIELETLKAGVPEPTTTPLKLQVLFVRESTLTSMSGVAIENMVVKADANTEAST